MSSIAAEAHSASIVGTDSGPSSPDQSPSSSIMGEPSPLSSMPKSLLTSSKGNEVEPISFPSAIPNMTSRQIFQPSKHLAYEAPSGCYTLDDLGLNIVEAVSPLAVTAPFPLFTREGVEEMRKEVLSQESLKYWSFKKSKFCKWQTREHSRKAAPFVHQVWNHPDVLRAVSEAAGLELVPIMDIEIGHCNIQLDGEKDALLKISPTLQAGPVLSPRQRAAFEKDAEDSFARGDDDAVVRLHIDAYPFVAVVMLSDVSNMVGGETAIQTGDGSMIKVRGPQVGSAVMMQGRYVKHMALKTFNTPERITMVCSFRAKDAMLDDASFLSTIKLMSKPNRLNYHWSAYRLRLMSERLSTMAAMFDAKKASFGDDDDQDGRGGQEVVNKEEFESWMAKQVQYMQWTVSELF